MTLAPWLDGAVSDEPSPEALTEVGLAALERARARPGRVRDSAFHLLAADALLTYACEAALDADDPDAALSTILLRAAEGR